MAVDAAYDPEDSTELSSFNTQMDALWKIIQHIKEGRGLCPARGYKVQLTNDEVRLLAMKNCRIAFDALEKSVQDVSLFLVKLEETVKESQVHISAKKGE